MATVRTRKLTRNLKGALVAEFTSNLYILFLFIAFPLLDLSVLGFRAFFLWFAANQAVSAASKANTYLQTVEITSKSDSSSQAEKQKLIYPSACEIAQTKANQIRLMLPGIHWEESDNNPDVQIVREPMNPSARNTQPSRVFSRGHGAPLESSDAPDPNANVYICQVVIKGQVDPLLTIPWCKIPGLSGPIDLTVSSQAKYENVPGLTM